MKKVLIVNDTLQYGGSDLVAVRLAESLDKSIFDVTYCIRGSEKGPFENELLKKQARIIHVPDNKLGYYRSFLFYLELLKNEHFDIVHSHLMFFSGIVLLAAKISGVSVRVAHSHFSQSLHPENGITKLARDLYRSIMRLLLKFDCTAMIACSIPTGNYLYGKNTYSKRGILLNNAIDLKEYEYNESDRATIRNEFKIPDDAIVLGHIGQMWYVKNHAFIVDIFNRFHSSNPNSYLMLVSDGPLRTEIENKCRDLGITDNVIFTGFRNDCNKLLMAMDCFVFPSIHEGFPLTLVEAQATKLPCIISDNVNSKTRYNENVLFESLNSNEEIWCKRIEELLSFERIRVDNSELINAFDIREISKELERIYIK